MRELSDDERRLVQEKIGIVKGRYSQKIKELEKECQEEVSRLRMMLTHGTKD